MTFASEAMLVGVGVYGDIFSSSFACFGCFAIYGIWFKNCWQLGHYLDITISLHHKFQIALAHKQDQSLMHWL